MELADLLRYWQVMRALWLTSIVVAILAALAVGASASTNTEAEADDPRLFSKDLAQAELDELTQEIARLQNKIIDALDEKDMLTIERDFIDLNDTARADVLAQAQGRARRMAVNAYVGIGGPPLSSIVLLDTQRANDLAYRHSLLRQQAERLYGAAETYALLLGQADENVVELSDEIDGVAKQVEAASRQLREAAEKVPEAEWFVSIAEIHEMADTEFESSGRAEPTTDQWGNLRFCESNAHGKYQANTGNTFYGAYQFTWETWGTVGGEGNPAKAPAAEQDARARLLFSQRGRQPWPICGRFLPG